MIITSLLPIILESHIKQIPLSKTASRLSVKYVIPVILIATSFFIYKLSTSTYGLAPIDIKSFLQAIYYFFVILIEIPLLLIEVFPHLFKLHNLILAILIVIFFVFLRERTSICENKTTRKLKSSKERLFVSVVLISLCSCSILFFLSQYPATTFGHYNRMMLPSLILYSVLLAWVVQKMLFSRLVVFPICISIFWVSSMIIQLNGFVESWNTREKILTDCVSKLNKVELGNNPYLIACVPFYNKKNYNNEEVFWLTWATSRGLKLFGLKQSVNVFPVCWRTLIDSTFNPNHNILNYIFPLPKEADYWYYEFDQVSGNSKLEKVSEKENIEQIFQHIVNNKINFHPLIPRERIRIMLKRKVLDNIFL